MMEAHAAWMAGAAHGIAGRLTHAFRETDRAAEIYASLGAVARVNAIQTNRAAFLLQLGRIVEATDVLRANRQYGSDQGLLEVEYFAVSNLGVARLAAGAAAEACELQRYALRLAERLCSDAFTPLALGDLGAAEAATGAFDTGIARLRSAAAMNARLQRTSTQAHDLARAARWNPCAQSAASDARAALAILSTNAASVKNAPEIFWCAALAFERAGDRAAAAYARRSGREILERRAAAIEDPEDRRCFCALPHHAELLAPSLGGTAAR